MVRTLEHAVADHRSQGTVDRSPLPSAPAAPSASKTVTFQEERKRAKARVAIRKRDGVADGGSWGPPRQVERGTPGREDGWFDWHRKEAERTK